MIVAFVLCATVSINTVYFCTGRIPGIERKFFPPKFILCVAVLYQYLVYIQSFTYVHIIYPKV
jgi:hypothetical protein